MRYASDETEIVTMFNLLLRGMLWARMHLLDVQIDGHTDAILDCSDDRLREVIIRRRAAARYQRKVIGERYYALRRIARGGIAT